MKSVKPIVLLSFLFFASVISEDIIESQSIGESNDISEFDDSDDFDFDNYDDGEDEDIIYTNMISSRPSPTPPATKVTSSTLIKSPPAPPTTPPPCKKWRCSMNGYTPIWKPDVSAACRDNYSKMGIMTKAVCQDKFCVKVCEKF